MMPMRAFRFRFQVCRISFRKTGSHFSGKCSGRHARTFDLHRRNAERRQMLMQLLLERSYNRHGVRDAEGVIDSYRNVDMQSVSEPTRLDVDDLLNTRNMFGGVTDFLGDVRIDAIEASRDDRLGGLP